MSSRLVPIFENHKRFVRLDDNSLKMENPDVLAYLSGFPSELQAIDNYQMIKSFLKTYQSNTDSYYVYRTYIERLFLWSLNVAQKSLVTLTSTNLQEFCEFHRHPPLDWVGASPTNRFNRIGRRIAQDNDYYRPNERWRPFAQPTARRNAVASDDSKIAMKGRSLKIGGSVIDMMLRVTRSFYQFLIEQNLNQSENPVWRGGRNVKKSHTITKAPYRQPLSAKSWDCLLKTCLSMAKYDPGRHERTLFIITTLHFACGTVSDITGTKNWLPVMGDFQKDKRGNWTRRTIDKMNRVTTISVSDEYMNNYMARYRAWLGLSLLPSWNDSRPLISTQDGRPGLSAGHTRRIVKTVIAKAAKILIETDQKEMNNEKFLSLSIACLCAPSESTRMAD